MHGVSIKLIRSSFETFSWQWPSYILRTMDIIKHPSVMKYPLLILWINYFPKRSNKLSRYINVRDMKVVYLIESHKFSLNRINFGCYTMFWWYQDECFCMLFCDVNSQTVLMCKDPTTGCRYLLRQRDPISYFNKQLLEFSF